MKKHSINDIKKRYKHDKRKDASGQKEKQTQPSIKKRKKSRLPAPFFLVVIFFIVALIGFLFVYGVNHSGKVQDPTEITESEKVETTINELKKDLKNRYNPHASTDSPLIINSSGDVFYQTDSVYGSIVVEAMKEWNDAFGRPIFKPSGTGQLVDFFVADVNLAPSDDLPNAVYPSNHIGLLNAGALKDDKQAIKQAVHELIAKGFGLPSDAAIFETGKPSPADIDRVNAIYEQAKADNQLSESQVPFRFDYGNLALRHALFFQAVPQFFSQGNLQGTDAGNALYAAYQDLASVDGDISADKLAAHGQALTDAYHDYMTALGVDTKAVSDNDLVTYQETFSRPSNITTIAGTASTNGVNEKQ